MSGARKMTESDYRRARKTLVQDEAGRYVGAKDPGPRPLWLDARTPWTWELSCDLALEPITDDERSHLDRLLCDAAWRSRLRSIL